MFFKRVSLPVWPDEDASPWIDRTDGVNGADLHSPLRRPAKEIGVNLALRDLAVKPGDDFEEYANGAWRKTTEIPADRSSIGVDFEVFQKAEKRNADLVREAGAGKPAAGTPQRMIADYYAAYMDTAGIEKRGLAPLKERLAKIAGIKSKTDLARALGQDLRADVDPLNATNFWTENLFGLFVTQALSDPSRTVPYLLQGGLGMPDREYYVSDKPEMAKHREAYQAYIGELLKLAGDERARRESGADHGSGNQDRHRAPRPDDERGRAQGEQSHGASPSSRPMRRGSIGQLI